MNQILFTPFECDRCQNNNAVKVNVAIEKKGDELVWENLDLCNKCIINMIAVLIKRIPWDERKAWVAAFKEGIIR